MIASQLFLWIARNKKRPSWPFKTLSQRLISALWEMGEPNLSSSMPRMPQTNSSCNRTNRGRSGRRAGSQHRYEIGPSAVYLWTIHILDRGQALTRACYRRWHLARASRNPSTRGHILEGFSEVLALSRKRTWTQTPQLLRRIAVWISMSTHLTTHTFIAPENRMSCSLPRKTMLWLRKQRPFWATLAPNLAKGKSLRDSDRLSRKRYPHSTSHT